MDKKWITIGDKVKVYFENVQYLEGKIIDIMYHEGQAIPEYSIRDIHGGLHTVQHFCRMSEI
jgi:hypothetical protein